MTIKPLQDVIKDICGHDVFPINAHRDDKELIKHLSLAARYAAEAMLAEPIKSRRPNEVGNKIEPYIINAINQIPLYQAEKPKTRQGNIKTAGYPDIIIFDAIGRPSYIECKTLSVEKNKDKDYGNFRSFYLSPSHDFKIIHDARHLLLSYVMKQENTLYKPVTFVLLDIAKLPCRLKMEWNAGNKQLYAQPRLASGTW